MTEPGTLVEDEHVTIVEFLLARIAEREAAEHRKFRRRRLDELAPADSAKYREVGNQRMGHPDDELGESAQWPDGRWMNRAEVEEWRAVVNEPAPDRFVLADCAAKRRIVEAAGTQLGAHAVMDGMGWEQFDQGRSEAYAEVLRDQAQPDADHPDFNPAWRA